MIDIVKLKLDLKMSDSMKVAGCHVLSRETYNEVHESLNELDRLRVFKKTFDEYELAQKQGFIAYENWKECEKELEELQRDVKRYIKLLKFNMREDTINYKNYGKEINDLEYKLSKVGVENE